MKYEVEVVKYVIKIQLICELMYVGNMWIFVNMWKYVITTYSLKSMTFSIFEKILHRKQHI